MRLIYMQATIDYMHSIDPMMLNDLMKYGEPEIKEVIREVLVEEPLAEIDLIEKTDISKVVF